MHILLAEDNPDHAELVIRMVQAHEIAERIDHVVHGEAVLDFLHQREKYADRASSPRPDLILLDLRLPRMDGLEVLREIKGTPELKRIPVIVLSSSESEDDIAQAYDVHANGYLVKPLDFGTFYRMLGDVCSYWSEWNKRPKSQTDRELEE